MATILRPPLVSQGQRKRPIAPVDFFGPPLTLGINPNARIAQLSDSAPPRKKAAYAFDPPNLLCSTLWQTSQLSMPLLSGKLSDSAPRRKPWNPEALLAQGFIVYDGPEAQVASLYDSAPQRRNRLSVEQVTNLLTNTLGTAPALGLPLLAVRLDASAPSAKPEARIEELYRPLTLGINPNAAVIQQSDSAPPRKRSAYGFDPPNLLVGTLAVALDLPLRAGRVDASAPPRKAAVYFEIPQNTLARQPVPRVQSLGSVEQSKRPTVFEHPPNRFPLVVLFATVPDVVGMTQADATTAIVSASLTVSVTTAYSGTVAVGLVISQSPAASTQLEWQMPVSIVVSLGSVNTPRSRRIIVSKQTRQLQFTSTRRIIH